MPKENSKNKVKRKNRNKMGTLNYNCIPSLSKRNVSSNWLKFLKSNGLPQDNFIHRKQCVLEKPVENKIKPITKVLAIDCEMVSAKLKYCMLARVSIVNFELECVYDKYVKPTVEVEDYRTRFSGIREEDLVNGLDFETVQKEVRELLKNKILVGHSVRNDLLALKFGHHEKLIRDTSTFPIFQEIVQNSVPSLKHLARVFLDEKIQEGEHDSVEDAKTAMKLYKKFRHEWEKLLSSSNKPE